MNRSAAGILPADQSVHRTAGKMPAAPWWWRLTSARFMLPMDGEKVVRLSLKLGWFGVPPSGGSNGLDRLKPGLQAVSGFLVPMHAEVTKGRSP